MQESNTYTHLQQAHHAQIAADYDLKRRYLALLPPQQVIEICLTFDYYVPPYIKAPIWPQNLSTAIANLQSSSSKTSESDKSKDARAGSEPVMDSLVDTSGSPESKEKGKEKEKEKPIKTEEPSKPPDPAPPIPATPASYPHQPYPAFQYHTPYYPWPGYSPFPPPPGSFPPAAQPPGSTAAEPTQSSDELPSYEEMLTEALTECTEPDGLMAPKDLFNWMAARYPLQSNFRPSASQALQRAYKRGRFEKTNTGKYRLNPNFDGPTTSRRSTRRPQTMNSASNAAQPIKSPFTHAPLIHNHLSFRPPPYPYPSITRYQPPQANGTASSAAAEKPLSKLDIGDPYEAAQALLKSLKEGPSRLIRMADEDQKPTEEDVVETAPNDGTAMDIDDRASLQAQLALLAVQLTEFAQETASAQKAEVVDTAGDNSIQSDDTNMEEAVHS